MSAHADAWYIQRAKDTICRDGELEIDDNAIVSSGADAGAYVQCWVWVEDDPLSPEEDDE
jgi:hypothetical protein